MLLSTGVIALTLVDGIVQQHNNTRRRQLPLLQHQLHTRTTTTTVAPVTTTTSTTTAATPVTTTVLTVVNGNKTQTYTLAQLKALQPTTGYGTTKNKAGVITGPNTYVGVALTSYY